MITILYAPKVSEYLNNLVVVRHPKEATPQHEKEVKTTQNALQST
jgi:hypothetical protein